MKSLQPRKLILAKIRNMTNSRELIPAKYIFFWLAKINTREN